MPDALDTDKLRELEAAMTPAPWEVDRGEEWSDHYPRDITIRGPMHPRNGVSCGESYQLARMSGGGLPSMDPDANGLVALRNAAPALLALAARAERMEAALRDARQSFDVMRVNASDVEVRMIAAAQLRVIDAALPAADRRAENDKHE